MIKIFKETAYKGKISGQFGPGGFLSDESYIMNTINWQDILMEINIAIMDEIDSGSKLGNQISKLSEPRVDIKEQPQTGKMMIGFPIGVFKNKLLQKFYKSLVVQALNNL